jgi:hypothetical protein
MHGEDSLAGQTGAPAAAPQKIFPQTPNPFAQVQLDTASLQFIGSLLQLRGSEPVSSPLRDAASGNVLLLNGQVFGGLEVPPLASDAALLLQALSHPGADVAALLAGLRGPWALVFWQHATRTLWFGRDPIGEPPCCCLEGVLRCHAPLNLISSSLLCLPFCPPCMQAAAACCCTCPAPATGASC